jgi:hypothetical protein
MLEVEMTTIDEQIAWANDLVSDLRMPHRLRFMHKAILASLKELKRIQSAEIGGKTLDNDNELLREARELLNEDWCGTSADSIGSKLISRINAHLASAEASQPASQPDCVMVPTTHYCEGMAEYQDAKEPTK